MPSIPLPNQPYPDPTPADPNPAPSHPPLPAETPGQSRSGSPHPPQAIFLSRTSLRAFRPPCHPKFRQTRQCHSRKRDHWLHYAIVRASVVENLQEVAQGSFDFSTLEHLEKNCPPGRRNRKKGRPVRRNSRSRQLAWASSHGCTLQSRDVQLDHVLHRGEDAARDGRVGIGEKTRQSVRPSIAKGPQPPREEPLMRATAVGA